MRRVSKEERMVSVGITIPLAWLEKIDRLRGKEPRSSFIRRLIKEGLKNCSEEK